MCRKVMSGLNVRAAAVGGGVERHRFYSPAIVFSPMNVHLFPRAPPFPTTLGKQHHYPARPLQREIRNVTGEATSHGKRSVKGSPMVMENDSSFLLTAKGSLQMCTCGSH